MYLRNSKSPGACDLSTLSTAEWSSILCTCIALFIYIQLVVKYDFSSCLRHSLSLYTSLYISKNITLIRFDFFLSFTTGMKYHIMNYTLQKAFEKKKAAAYVWQIPAV